MCASGRDTGIWKYRRIPAAMPGSVDAPKNVTLEYNIDYWDTEPSSLLVRWKNPSSIKKLYSDWSAVKSVKTKK